MNLSDFGTEQFQAYYEARLDRLSRQDAKGEVSTHCPFHDDRTASFSVNMNKGVWCCHAGCGGGNVLQFEMKVSDCDDAEALKAIFDLAGQPFLPAQGEQGGISARYQYADESGHPLFTVTKFMLPNGKKTFRQGHKDSAGKWVGNMDGVRRVIYNLRDVVGANTVFIAEGEKDCDTLRATFGAGDSKVKGGDRIAFTTNPGGAGKWLPEYSPNMTGKDVVIFADNDDVGRQHAEMVAASVYRYAHRVKVVHMPDLAEKGDVSDYLESHTDAELKKLMAAAPFWSPRNQDGEPHRFIPAPVFVSQGTPEIDWIVEDVIQRGANGFICAAPKIGKSWVALDMGISLALGLPWMGFDVPRRTKVALVSREDNPALTRWRMRRLIAGKASYPEELAEHLYVNSRESQKMMMLDNSLELADLITDLKHRGTEFLILDVFNVLHAADENDNTAMRQVLNLVTEIQNEVGCSICIVHHWNKSNQGSITEKLRGASAIAGWAEWVIGISLKDPVQRVRRMEFDLKVASAPEPLNFQIDHDTVSDLVKLKRLEDFLPTEARNAIDIVRGSAGNPWQ
jgi:hypothetical protein